jgi:hypothetical protein
LQGGKRHTLCSGQKGWQAWGMQRSDWIVNLTSVGEAQKWCVLDFWQWVTPPANVTVPVTAPVMHMHVMPTKVFFSHEKYFRPLHYFCRLPTARHANISTTLAEGNYYMFSTLTMCDI